MNNLWCNLRLTDYSGNQKNLSRRKDNRTGVTGVVWYKNGYVAQIQVNKKVIYLGRRKTIEEASELRKQAELKYNFHKNHGK